MIIGVVGPCGAGKSTLLEGLKLRGINARHIAQEHSYVPDMWKRMTNPEVLIYLQVSYENTVARRKLDWTFDEYLEQIKRLSHAHHHADLIVDTNALSAAEVLQKVLIFLNSNQKTSNS